MAIVGAGLGGLALAQSTARGEPDLLVLEKDRSFGAVGRTIRVHCNARINEVAGDCLPGPVFELFHAAQSTPDARHVYLDERLTVTGVDERPAPEIALDTRTTREVLSVGLDARLLFGAEVQDVDGTDVLVGSGDRVRAQLCVVASGADGTDRRAAFAAQPRDVGLLSWYGCVDLDEHEDLVLPEWMYEGFVVAVGERVKVAMGRYEPSSRFAELARRHASVSPRRYAFWNVIAPAGNFPAHPSAYGQDIADAARVLADMTVGWDPWLHGLVARTTPGTLGSLALRTSAAGAERPSDSRVMYVGDAAHQMLPAALSTSVAFEDAAVLGHALADAAQAGTSLIEAAAVADMRIRESGFSRVREAELAAAPAFGITSLM